MKIAGWIILALGCLSLLGCLLSGTNPVGPIFWIGLGIYFLYRGNQKKKEKEDKDKWEKQ